MRTSSLQYLYLQKPVTLTIIICIISVLPWIALGDFSTKGEPREAAVAISMLETGNWILPQVYADEFAYKPPLAPWMMAAFSYPQGYVSEFTSRLPSAIAFIALIIATLVFFSRRRPRFQEVFISVMLMITCVELHRAAMTTRVDMLLTTFIVLGLFQLFRWEEKLELKGLPIPIPLLLSCAVLTKGPVGIILPLFIFFVYLLMLRKYSLLVIIRSLLYIGIASSFIPCMWYVAAWQRGGEEFLDLVLAENFGRFFSVDNLDIDYNLGHENGPLYNIKMILAGFAPWTLFFFFSLFGMKLVKPSLSFGSILKKTWARVLSMDKVKLFSLVSLVCIILFYTIPSSKRGVYLLPAYPFMALFLAQYSIYLTEYRRKVTRFFAGLLVSVTIIVLIVVFMSMSGAIDVMEIAKSFTNRERTIEMIQIVCNKFNRPSILTTFIIGLNLFAIITVLYQLSKKINIKILYSTIALVFMVNMMIDGIVMRSIRNGTSSRAFAKHIIANYPLNENNVFVVNNLKEFANLYGLNFYMGNMFHDIEDRKPNEGYFLSTERDFDGIIAKFKEEYVFTKLTSTPNYISDVRDKMILCSFTKK